MLRLEETGFEAKRDEGGEVMDLVNRPQKQADRLFQDSTLLPRMKPLPRIALVAAAIGLLAFSTSCSKPTPRISIGINAWPTFEYLYLAKVKGFYQKRGVDVKLVSYNSLADARRAYELGHLDALACTLVEHCQILDNSDRNPQIAMVIDYSSGGDVVIADEGIDRVDQIAGARIGLEVESLGVFMLSRLLEKASLRLQDITPVKSDQLSLERQMAEDMIDIAITYPPHSLSILALEGTKTLFTTEELPNEVLDVIVFEEETILQHEPVVRSIISAIYEAQQWASENKPVAHAIMAEREGISPSDFRELLESDIHITSKEEQERFFHGETLLTNRLAECDSILREMGQVHNEPRYENTFAKTLYIGTP